MAGFLTVVWWTPPWAFFLMVGVVLALAAHEWAALCGSSAGVQRYFSGVLLVLWGLSEWGARLAPVWAVTLGFAVSLTLWLFLAFWLGRHLQVLPESTLRRWRVLLGSLVLVPAAFGIGYLYQAPSPWMALPHGWVLYVLGLVMAADTGAWLAGRWFGRSHFAPALSPGKTVEGLMGAVLAVLLLSSLWVVLLGAVPGWWWWPVSVLVALMSVWGDLLESLMKRWAGVKDSGGLLPGHGGVLDRIDSLTAAVPVLAFAVLVSTGQPGSG